MEGFGLLWPAVLRYRDPVGPPAASWPRKMATSMGKMPAKICRPMAPTKWLWLNTKLPSKWDATTNCKKSVVWNFAPSHDDKPYWQLKHTRNMDASTRQTTLHFVAPLVPLRYISHLDDPKFVHGSIVIAKKQNNRHSLPLYLRWTVFTYINVYYIYVNLGYLGL